MLGRGDIDGEEESDMDDTGDVIIVGEPSYSSIESRSDTGVEGAGGVGGGGGDDMCDQTWRGYPIDAIHRNLDPFELDHIDAAQPKATHIVLHKCPIQEPDNAPPRPYKAPLKWDAHHVRLPCANESQYPVENDDGTAHICSRWEMIEQALLQPINSSEELQAAILTYNSRYQNDWNFHALHQLFSSELDESESRVFFEDLLPRIVRLALRLPELVQAPIPLLKQCHNAAVTLTQEQISCLLANAFLCTFPRRNTLKRKSEYSNFPDINFNRLFQSSGPSVLEKLKCIFHYFRRVCPTERDASNVPTGCVTFMRRTCKPVKLPDWTAFDAPLGGTPLHVNDAGTIEDQGIGLLQVDFANKFLGGGVLGGGCVQEEIRFVICPELMVSKLITECLRPTEALIMVGCERYSDYTGYASTFEWAGNHDDQTPRDNSRRRMTAIVAIDALHFNQSANQFHEEFMLRELNKAYVGFLHTLQTPAPGVATGNWGCGAFGGDPYLKALLQLMVCTTVDRPLAYYTFGNGQLRDSIYDMYQILQAKGTTVRQLWALLRSYKYNKSQTLYQFIHQELDKHDSLRHVEGASQTKNKEQEATAVKTTRIGKSNTKQHSSPDIFAEISSPDSSELGNRTPNLLSDDEVTNAMLLAAGLEADAKIATTINNQSSTTAAATSATSATAIGKTAVKSTRQLSLLEMLDRSYDKGTPTDSKRQRQTVVGTKTTNENAPK